MINKERQDFFIRVASLVVVDIFHLMNNQSC